MAGDLFAIEGNVASKEYVDAAVAGGGGGGAALPDLFFDVLKLGSALGWSWIVASNYVWGGRYQALDNLTIAKVKATTQQTSGTLILSVWVGGSRVKTGTAAITGAGTYTVTFNSPLSVTTGQQFTVSATVTGGGSSDIPSADYDTTYVMPAGPKLRLLASNLYGYGDTEPTSTSSSRLFGVIPVLG